MVKIRITMKELEEMMVIPHDKKEFVDAWIHVVEKGFKWNEFILFVQELTQSYKVQIVGEGKEQVIKIRKNQYNDYWLLTKQLRYEIKVTEYIDRLTKFILSGQHSSLTELYKNNDDFIDIIPPMSFIQYLLVEEKKRAYEYIVPKQLKATTSKPKSSKKKSEPKQVEYTLLDAIKVYQKTSSDGKRKYEKHSCLPHE